MGLSNLITHNTTMKQSKNVSSSRRKSRKAHFSAKSLQRRRIMSAPLSRELRAKYGVRSVPITKKDTVRIVRGTNKSKEGKVNTVYRSRYCIYVDKVERENINIPIHPSNVVITKLSLNKDRNKMLARRRKVDSDKGKIQQEEVDDQMESDDE